MANKSGKRKDSPSASKDSPAAARCEGCGSEKIVCCGGNENKPYRCGDCNEAIDSSPEDRVGDGQSITENDERTKEQEEALFEWVCGPDWKPGAEPPFKLPKPQPKPVPQPAATQEAPQTQQQQAQAEEPLRYPPPVPYAAASQEQQDQHEQDHHEGPPDDEPIPPPEPPEQSEIIPLVIATEEEQANKEEADAEKEDFFENAQQPALHPAAYYGLPGAMLRAIEQEIEPHPAAVLANSLTIFGNNVGRGAWFDVDQTRHYPTLFVAIVGKKASGKGAAWEKALWPYQQQEVVPSWCKHCIENGVGSAEGLVERIAEGYNYLDISKDESIEIMNDQRCLLRLGELRIWSSTTSRSCVSP
jgi:hypothetical protein